MSSGPARSREGAGGGSGCRCERPRSAPRAAGVTGSGEMRQRCPGAAEKTRRGAPARGGQGRFPPGFMEGRPPDPLGTSRRPFRAATCSGQRLRLLLPARTGAPSPRASSRPGPRPPVHPLGPAPRAPAPGTDLTPGNPAPSPADPAASARTGAPRAPGPGAAPAPQPLYVSGATLPSLAGPLMLANGSKGGKPALPRPISPHSLPSHLIRLYPISTGQSPHSPCPAPALPAEITALPVAVPAAKMAEGAGEERAPRRRRQGRPILPPCPRHRDALGKGRRRPRTRAQGHGQCCRRVPR